MLSKNKYYFPPSARLRKSREFGIVGKMGCRIHTPHFILLSRPSPDGISKLGITVSRKVGNAVCRNRIKRLLREYFRINRNTFGKAVELSVIVKRNAGDIKAISVEQELHLLKKKG